MDYEKKYNEALERARQIRNGNPSSGTAIVVCEQIFPELRESESEDERIRKEIISYLDFAESHNLLRAADYEKKKGWIDWLERKKIPSVSFNPALGFDPGSAVVYHNDESEDEMVMKWILEKVQGYVDSGILCSDEIQMANKALTWLEKQKGNQYFVGYVKGYSEGQLNPKQKEIPMPNSTELIEMWDKEEAMLKEKDFRGDTWRIAYNAFLDGFGKGYMVKRDIEKQKEQKELPLMDGNADLYFDEWNQQKQNPTKRQCFEEGVFYALRLQQEQNREDEEHDFVIYHPLKNGNGKYECIPYSFYGSLSAFSEDKDLIDFLRTCFYTKEECEEWIKQKEQKPDIALIQRSWYMEGYHDREFGMEPRWTIKTGDGGPKHELNPRYGQPLAEQQYYSKLNDLERAIHRGFLVAGVENVPVTIIKETAKDCLAHMPAEWSEEDKNKIDVIIRLVEQNSGWPDRAIKEYVNWLKSLRPQPHWKPSEDEERLINTSISFLKDFADKGYENAVECIDWLKPKLNGNSCK